MARELNKEFSWKTATFMARLSYHAYDGEDEFKKVFSKDWDDISFLSNGGTECYILTCPKNYIVAFRGTQPTSWEDNSIKEKNQMDWLKGRVKEISTWSGASLVALGLLVVLGGPFVKLAAYAAIIWGVVSMVKKQG